MIAPLTVERRPAGPSDEALVRTLVLESRPDLLLLPAQVRDEIGDLQVRAQRRQHAADHPAHREELMLLDGEPVGRIVVAESASAVRVLDLVVAAAHRGRGIARRTLAEVLAAAGDRPVRLAVQPENVPAHRLYTSLGFVTVGEGPGGRLELEHRAEREAGQ